MRIRLPAAILAAVACSCLADVTSGWAQAPTAAITARIEDAKPGDVRLLISGGLLTPLETIRAEAERRIGRRLVIEYGPSRTLQRKIESGQPFELTVLTRQVVDQMAAQGKVRPDGVADFAHVLVGVAQRGGDPKEVGTPEALKATLLGASQIRYFAVGASLPTVAKTFAQLGVADVLKPRVLLLTSADPVPDAPLKPGEYELLFNLDSEILPTPPKGWFYLGSVPAPLQVPVTLSAGVGAHGDAEAAQQVITLLKGPLIEPALKAGMMTR